MPTITKKELEEYRKMCYNRDHGRILTTDGLRFIYEAHKNDPEAIGKHILKHWSRYRIKANMGGISGEF